MTEVLKMYLLKKNEKVKNMLGLIYDLATIIFAITVIAVLINRSTFNINAPDGLILLIILLSIDNIITAFHRLRRKNIL